VNFTREPIIETIISPKEGYKLLVKNSKGSGGEEYYVDAVEVVSFGRAFFFRSLEKPKAFLVPVSDYEVLEAKETRVALKNVSHEKHIKIGGGREAPMRPSREEREQESSSSSDEAAPAQAGASSGESSLEAAIESRMDKRRDRRRHRRRRGGGEEQEWQDRKPKDASQESTSSKTEEGGSEEPRAAPLFSALIPPPPTLISEKLGRYREKEAAESKEEKRELSPSPEAPSEGADSEPLNRTKLESTAQSFTSTHFTPLFGGNDAFF